MNNTEDYEEHWTDNYATVYLVVVACILIFFILWAVSTIWFHDFAFPIFLFTIALCACIVGLMIYMVKSLKSRNHIKF